MTIRWVPVSMLIVGCTGEEPPRTIPVYEEGVVLEGNCEPTDVVATDAFALTELYEIELTYDPYLQIDGDLPGEAGTVVKSERKFLDLLTELNFDTTTFPLIDFETQQIGAVWHNARKSCGLDIDGAHILTLADGSAVFDVTMVDIRKNCDDNCETPSHALVMNIFSNEVETSICRRIEPGCDPN